MMPDVITPMRAVVTISIDGIIAVTIIARTVIPITINRVIGRAIIRVPAVIVTMMVAMMIEAPQYQSRRNANPNTPSPTAVCFCAAGRAQDDR